MKIPLLSFVFLQVFHIHAVVVISPRNRTSLHHHHKRLRRHKTETNEPDVNKCSSEIARLESANQKLRANFQKQKEAEKQLAIFSKGEAEEEHNIDSLASNVARETESEALADMLAMKWKEMRKYKLPEFVDYKKQYLLDLRREEQVLEKELMVAEQEKHACFAGEAQGDTDDSQRVVPEVGDIVKAVQDHRNARRQYHPRYGFWEMNPTQQQSVLKGSAVYLVGGILAAILYKQANAMYPSFFRPSPRSARPEDSDDYGFHVLGCVTEPKLCVLGLCCPCMMWSDTLGRKGLLSYWPAFAVFFGLLVLTPYTHGASWLVLIIVGVSYRQRIRKAHGIKPKGVTTVAYDVLLWCCCQPCAIIQEAREDIIRHTDHTAWTSD